MEINANNYKEVLLQWLENELSPEEVLQAEAFILVNEAAAREWILLQKTKLQPTAQVSFPKKHLLLKEETETAEIFAEKATIKPLYRNNYRKHFLVAASMAAALLLFFLIYKNDVSENQNNTQFANEQKIDSGKLHQPANSQTAQNNNIKGKIYNDKAKPTKSANHIAKAEKHKINKPGKAFSAPAIYGKEEVENLINENELLEKVALHISFAKHDFSQPLNKIKITKLAAQNEKNRETALEKNTFAEANNLDENERGKLGMLIHFFTKTIQIKKQVKNDQNYYALSVETEKIKIEKTFKSNF